MRTLLQYITASIGFILLVWVYGCNGQGGSKQKEPSTGSEYKGQILGCKEVYDDLFCPKKYDPKSGVLSSMKPNEIKDMDGNPVVLDKTDREGNTIIWVKVDRNGTRE